MNNVNISKVYLLGVPLENDYKNTLYFASASAQQSYFASQVLFSFTDFSYQRKDHFIRVPRGYDDVYKCNYVMYQNTAYSNKWFYAFITKIEYVDDGRTDVYIETDVIQTWLFDYTVKPSFVEREHVSDDTIGIHTVPEGLETGEYIINNKTSETQNLALCVVVGSSASPGELINLFGGKYNGIPSGLAYYKYRLDEIVGESSTLQSYLEMLERNGKSDAVSGMFLAPLWLTGNQQSVIIPNTNSVGEFEFTSPKITELDNYVPRNNKLLCYPYCYVNLSNGQGSSAILHQELWKDLDVSGYYTTKVYGCLTPGCSIRAVPKNYKNVTIPYDEGVNLGKLPQLNWTTDQYTNWLTQNGVNIATSVTTGVISTGVGVATGNGLAAVGGLMSIANSLGEVYKHSLVPPQVEGNLNNGDVNTASGNNCFTVYNMTIKHEYAQIIDKFFDMFGYKVNLVKVPNSNHRQNWWYTKCIDVNIDGDIPNIDMQKIKDCYNKGITFWKNASNIQNYSLSNDIV